MFFLNNYIFSRLFVGIVVLAVFAGLANAGLNTGSYTCSPDTYPCATCDPDNPNKCLTCYRFYKPETRYDKDHDTHAC